jgi:hypothetical protein
LASDFLVQPVGQVGIRTVEHVAQQHRLGWSSSFFWKNGQKPFIRLREPPFIDSILDVFQVNLDCRMRLPECLLEISALGECHGND